MTFGQRGRFTRFLVAASVAIVVALQLVSALPAQAANLFATASCTGNNLDVKIFQGDGPFNITGTGPGLPANGVGTGITTLTGPGTWTITVTETTGDLESSSLVPVVCPPPQATASCNGNNLDVDITSGNAPFDITGFGPGLPANGVGLGVTSLSGPGPFTWTVVVTGANGAFLSLGTINCNLPLNASAACNGNNLDVDITNGNAPFDITGSGPGVPANGVGLGVTSLSGPGPFIWNIVVTAASGDTMSLGTINCDLPLNATAACNGNNLDVDITNGNAPFDITGSGPGVPANGVGLGITSLSGPGPFMWNIVVTAANGNTMSLGTINCDLLLNATAACNGNNLDVDITSGNAPFDITGLGPGLPANGVGLGVTSLSGPPPFTWTIVVTAANGNTISLGTIFCDLQLNASAACNGTYLDVDITSGNAPFDITGSGPGVPANGVGLGITTLSGPGPFTWTISVTSASGDTISLGTITCNIPLAASAQCNGTALDVSINGGDAPYNITGTGNGLPANGVGNGVTPLGGPGSWTGVTVTETAGDLETVNLGNFTCPAATPLQASAQCNGTALDVSINGGDAPYNITGTGNGLPANGVGNGVTPLGGPGSWTGVTVTETAGDLETVNLGNFTCPAATPLQASAQCNGTALDVSINGGDAPYNITGTGSGLPANGVGNGVTPLGGPGSWTGVTVTETAGDLETVNLGNFTCPAATPLQASAQCNGTALDVSINGGDAPYNITGTGSGLPANGVGNGVTPLGGPGTWTGVTVTETAGDLETVNLGNFTCPAVGGNALRVSLQCSGPDLVVNITSGDALFTINGAGPGLPVTVSIGKTTLAGPGPWTGITITEQSGDFQTLGPASADCAAQSTPPPPGPPCPAVSDGRINNDPARDCAPPVAVYCTQHQGFDIYRINWDNSRGWLLLHITQEDIDALGVPEGADATIAESHTPWVIVSRLTTGEFQVNAWWGDGKPYTINWPTCPATGVNHLQPQPPNE